MPDPLLSLKKLPAPELGEQARGRELHRLRAAIENGGPPRRRRPARRRRLALLVPAVLIATGGAAAALDVGHPDLNPAHAHSGIGCLETVSGDAGGAIIKPDPAHPDPVAACRRLWEHGDITFPRTPPDPLPPLTGCVSSRGTMYVFPTSSVHACVSAAEKMSGAQAYPLPRRVGSER